MKKFISVLMTAVIALSVCSCGKNLNVSRRVSYESLTAEQMKEQADLVVICEPTGEARVIPPPEDDPTSVYTEYTARVCGKAKGEAADEISVRIYGGEYEGSTYSSTETQLEKGTRYFMYLNKQEINGETVYYCQRGKYGRFIVKADGEVDFAENSCGDDSENKQIGALDKSAK